MGGDPVTLVVRQINQMDRVAVSALVRDTIANYGYDSPKLGGLIGTPWPAEKVRAQIEKLRISLVEPYLQLFELRETFQQIGQPDESHGEYWVVAEYGDFLEWFDPTTGEFGVGQRFPDSALPVSIGVRGDLIGVFCAM